MKKILTASQMRSCDEYTINTLAVPSRALMDRAAKACAGALADFDLTHLVCVCGAGNNGGDGMAIAYIMARCGIDTTVVFPSDEASCTPETAFRLERLHDAGIPVTDSADFSDATAIVDALFGIGLTREVTGRYADLIDAVNASSAKVLSVDIPSGISADSGRIMGKAVRADRTVTISNIKPGLCLYPGAEYCGDLVCADIDIPDSTVPDGDCILCVEDSDLAAVSERPAYSNKGTFGRVLVIGGCVGMAGAAYLTALAAYRSGAGLVEILTHPDNRTICQTLLPEAVYTAYDPEAPEKALAASLARTSSAVIGPGLSKSDTARRLVRFTVENSRVPTVFDADALNIIAEERLAYPKTPTVITPHLVEMYRLTGKTVPDIASDLIRTAREYADENRVTCVLKDARSVIASAEHTYLNLSGCSALAKGGSGDVLAGVIAALLASGIGTDLSAAYGAYLHGKAGRKAAEIHGIHGVLARDIADAVRR